ncbi:mediator complex subunit 13 carboxy-terminal protein [Ceratobasidium sp. AG-Ba]|nr:mediator complex subunit 13 carboxy-terminal protein [Ceratobasidium sp. AG-Ba]
MSHPLPPKPSPATTAGAAAPPPRPAQSQSQPPPNVVQTLITATVHASAQTLVSGIALPPNPAVVCRVWTGPDEGIDAARKYILDVAAGAPDVPSALATLVRPDAELSLWVFAIVSGDTTAPRLSALDFHQHGLKETTPVLARLDLAHLYPCSSQCDRSPMPCAECTKPRPQTICPLARSAPRISRPVRRPLRRLYAYWLAALRSLILDRLSNPRLLPTKSGVLVSPPDNPTGEWGKPWLDPSRTLTHAHVHISLAHPLPRPSAPNQILVHLLPQPTALVPFPSITNPSPGTAVVLLPSSTPAYALAPYTGPAPQGFLSLLAGRGVQPSSATSPCMLIWLPLPSNFQSNTASSPANFNALPTPSAATPAAMTITGPRGMYVVWPRALCVVDTAVPPIDVARLPNVPAHLMSTGPTIPAPTKSRRFPTKKPSIPRPIALAQPAPTTFNSTSLAALANSASNLIDTIVRTREKEKEKQRARLERARSGSAVPIPVPTLSGASTPTTSTMPIAPPPPIPLHIQTQTPTGSALYPSPSGTTPLHVSPIQTIHNHTAPMSATVNTSPVLEIGMDLFGDPDGVGSDFLSGFGNDTLNVSGEPFNYGGTTGFGPSTAYDTTTTSTLIPGSNTTTGAGGSMDLFGDLWEPGGGQDPKSGQEDDDMAVGDADFNFFDQWPGSGVSMPAAPTDFSNLDLGLDLGLDLPPVQDTTEVIDLDPTSPASASSAPTSIPTPTFRPYFPLTPPLDDVGEYTGAKKSGLFDPLRFTQKFEDIDEKYRSVDGKFVYRLGPGTISSNAKSRPSLAKQILPASASWSHAPVGQDVPQPRLQLQTQLPTPIPSPNSLRRLRAGYIGLTNPSVKRMRSLRRAHQKQHPASQTGPLSVFARDWIPARPPSPCATMSDADSDSDSDDSDDGMSVAITIGATAPSRGTSPPLSAITSAGSGAGVPPGPALLLAHFRPSVLGSGLLGEVLPWPELKDKESKTPGPGPVSVPTPVSPGGMVIEPSKESIEAAANLLAREAVDNWAWGSEVGALTWNEIYAPSRSELVLLGECLKALGSVMNLSTIITAPKIEVVNEVLTDRPYHHGPRFEKLKHPKLAVGHSGQVAFMSPFALRFWETVGLEPLGGAKDITAFAIYEGSAEGTEEDGIVERWLETVTRVYELRKLGKHTLGESGNIKRGLVRIHWDSANKTLGSLTGLLSTTNTNVVFYVILPPSTLSVSWIQSWLVKLHSDAKPNLTENHQHLIIQLVPCSSVFQHTSAPLDSRKHVENTAVSLYERIPRVVGRRVRRQILPLSCQPYTTVHVPAFTIGRWLTPRFRFSMDWPDKQRETMDRHMFLHVAYRFSKSRRWLCAACLDERGEAYETKVWRVVGVPDEEEEEADLEEQPSGRGMRMNKYVNLVWHFAMRFAKRAGIEWRVAICRMGTMGIEELEAWNKCTLENLRDVRIGVHVSVLGFDPRSGVTISSGCPPTIKLPSAPAILPVSSACDIETNDFFLLPGFDTDINPNSTLDLGADHFSHGFLPLATAHFLRLTDPPIIRPMGKTLDVKYEDIPVLSISSQLHLLLVAVSRNSSLWKAGGDPWRELLHSFYSLTVLTQAKMPSLDRLPLHLAMLTAITNVVDNRDLVPADSLSDC